MQAFKNFIIVRYNHHETIFILLSISPSGSTPSDQQLILKYEYYTCLCTCTDFDLISQTKVRLCQIILAHPSPISIQLFSQFLKLLARQLLIIRFISITLWNLYHHFSFISFNSFMHIFFGPRFLRGTPLRTFSMINFRF